MRSDQFDKRRRACLLLGSRKSLKPPLQPHSPAAEDEQPGCRPCSCASSTAACQSVSGSLVRCG
jgi:hypothetical protein